MLYVALSSSRVGTIVGVSSKTTGPVTLDAQWNVSASPASITVDPARDRLFVLVSDLQGSILAYDDASTRTTVAPGSVSRTFTVANGFAFAPAIFLESSSDRLYVVDQNKIFIVSAAGSANGATPSTLAQLSTMNTGLTAVVVRP